MSLKNKRREMHGVVGALGTLVLLVGLLTSLYSPTTAIVASFGVWAVGVTLVNVFTDPPG